MSKKVPAIVFILTFVIIMLVLPLIFVRGEKEILYKENRKANLFPFFSLDDFLNGDYQNNLELAINDQMLFGETIKDNVNNIKNTIFYYTKIPAPINTYYTVTGMHFAFNNAEYLLYRPQSRVTLFTDYPKTIADHYNSINVDKYLYLVSSDYSYNLAEDGSNDKYYTIIKDLYSSFKTDYLKISSFEEYQNYYYKTDHHWNYKGAYQGYIDIIKLLLGENEEILIPTEERDYGVLFYGSKARQTGFYRFKENFINYLYDLPDHKVYVNEEEKPFGKKSAYLNNDSAYVNDDTKHYNEYYGWDTREIIYDFKSPKKDNLLIIGFSDANAVMELIASHFNKTYALDIRYTGPFDIHQYIRDNKIDKFLYITNPDTIYYDPQNDILIK